MGRSEPHLHGMLHACLLLLDGVELGLTVYLAVGGWVLNIIRFFFISVNFSNMLLMVRLVRLLVKGLEVPLVVCINLFRILLNFFHLGGEVVKVR